MLVVMMRYSAQLVGYLLFLIVAILAAPILPLFASMRYGPTGNGNGASVEPRLPSWLFWFDTSTDNSLWGDSGWRMEHCPAGWGAYRGMVGWLFRNPAAGFCWSVLAHAVKFDEKFALSSSGCGLDLDKGQGQQGYFCIKSSYGAFHFRRVKELWGLQFSFEAGWLLDVYLKDPLAIYDQPMALFIFQPGIRKVRK